MTPSRLVAWGIAIFLALLPTYQIRFTVGPLPTTLLEVLFGVLVLLWLLSVPDWTRVQVLRREHPTLFYASALFLAAASVSVFTAIDVRVAAGLWKAYFFEPLLFSLVCVTTLRTRGDIVRAVFGLSLCAGLVSIVAITQYAFFPDGLTLFGHTFWEIPNKYWRDVATRRAVSVFAYPNAVGLFLAPLVPVFFWRASDHWRLRMAKVRRHLLCVLWYVSVIALSLVAIVLAHSSGALAGLAVVALVAGVYARRTRWIVIGLAVASALFILVTPLKGPFADEFLLQGYSGKIRVQMWKETLQQLETTPLLGNGLGSYQEAVAPFHQFTWAEIYLYPHTVFLNFWTEIGALGMIAFAIILLWCFVHAWFAKESVAMAAGMAVLVVLVHGLVDVPYFKNDLAMAFWFMVAVLVVASRQKQPDRLQ